MALGQYPGDNVESQKPTVQMRYQQLLESGMTPKDAAKTAQEETGVSVVSGRVITKKIEFSSKGKAGYSGQYPGYKYGSVGKQWKPAAWPQ